MKNWHTEQFIINDTNLDSSSAVPISELIKLFQIATYNHSNEIGLDHVSMLEYSNAFWVVSKIKLCLLNPIKVQNKLNVTTWTHELGGVRALRDCEMVSNNSVCATVTAEWCCLDADTRKLRKMSSIKYPELEMEKTNNLNNVFTNMKDAVNENDFVYSRQIRSTDIDINKHTNNLKYNYMALDAFNVEELSGLNISEYEIYFVNESYEGDIINIYKKVIDNYYYIEGKIEEKTIFRAVFKVLKK